MLKLFFLIVLFIHGMIHILGFLKAFQLAEINQLTQNISKPMGMLWLLALVLFLVTALQLISNHDLWWITALAAVILSQVLIILFWQDAKFGTIANIIILLAVIAGYGFWSFENIFNNDVAVSLERSLNNEKTLITEKDIEHLPKPVQKYLTYTGALGKSKPQNVYIEFDAEMYKKPGDKPMKSHSVQYNFYGEYSRLFQMEASKMGIPFRAIHIYKNEKASFQVKVAELFKVVDVKGEELTKAETVTLLNDMCIFAPGSLIDNLLTWSEKDSLTVKVTLTNGKYVVSAMLYFNETGELINFVSDDRSALQDDGTMKQVRWTTPISDYKDFGGRKIPTKGKTIWNYPEGDFTYGVFKLKNIKYNVTKDNL